MYIDKIKLSNFRLFSHNLIIEKFSPGINIFNGPNGSGKSSFFQAFRLLLHGKILDIKNELATRNFSWNLDKTSDFLLIQVTLDNSKKDFQIKKKTITIKRLISRKINKIWISEYCLEKKI